VKPPWPPSGRLLCKLIEARGWLRLHESAGARFYQSPDNPKLIVFVEHSGWSLPEQRAQKFIKLLGLKRSDFEKRRR
jgi:predicted RNA binding protein YcfA (HicA-like mRNA interferase family)